MNERASRSVHGVEVDVMWDHYFECWRWIAYLGGRAAPLARRFGFIDESEEAARQRAQRAFDGPEYRELRGRLT